MYAKYNNKDMFFFFLLFCISDSGKSDSDRYIDSNRDSDNRYIDSVLTCFHLWFWFIFAELVIALI